MSVSRLSTKHLHSNGWGTNVPKNHHHTSATEPKWGWIGVSSFSLRMILYPDSLSYYHCGRPANKAIKGHTWAAKKQRHTPWNYMSLLARISKFGHPPGYRCERAAPLISSSVGPTALVLLPGSCCQGPTALVVMYLSAILPHLYHHTITYLISYIHSLHNRV